MDIRVATYANTQISANPSPARSRATEAASAAASIFSALVDAPQQAAAPATQATSNAVQKPQTLASNPEGRGTLIDILV